MRDFKARNPKTAPTARDHWTGRTCSLCGGRLHDTIINFGESLPERELNLAFKNSAAADLCLAMGSSLSVSPANYVPRNVGETQGAKLVIVNIQRTPLDHLADLVIHAETDTVMTLLMQELSLEVPPFKLHRRFVIGAEFTTDLHQTTNQTSVKDEVDSTTEACAHDEAGARTAESTVRLVAPVATETLRLRVGVRGLVSNATGTDDVPFRNATSCQRRRVRCRNRTLRCSTGSTTEVRMAMAQSMGSWW